MGHRAHHEGHHPQSRHRHLGHDPRFLLQAIERIRQFAKKLYLFGSGQNRSAWCDDVPVLRHWGLYGAMTEDHSQPTMSRDNMDDILSEDLPVPTASFERDALLPHA